MSDKFHTIRRAFSQYLSSNRPSGSLAEIAKRLAEEGIQNSKLRDLIPLREEREYSAVQSDLLDLVLFYITFCLEDHHLTSEECSNVHYLKAFFHIQEEDFYTYKCSQVKQILSAQISRILSDQNVDRTEAIQQVELQRCFGLSYDQFLQITHPHVERIVNELIGLINADGMVTQTERSRLVQQILALDTVYILNPEQRRMLDDLAE